MTPEIATKARAALSLSADNVSDEKLDDAVAEKALALSAENATLKSTVTTLTTERDAAKADLTAKATEVLSLSASLPKAPDALTLSMFQENIEAKREAAITAGAISAADAKAFDAMLADTSGTPNVLALSAVGTSKKPFAFQFWDAFAKLGTAIKTGNTLPREAVPAGQGDAKKPLSEPEFRETMDKTGTPCSSDAYANYLKNRTA